MSKIFNLKSRAIGKPSIEHQAIRSARFCIQQLRWKLKMGSRYSLFFVKGSRLRNLWASNQQISKLSFYRNRIEIVMRAATFVYRKLFMTGFFFPLSVSFAGMGWALWALMKENRRLGKIFLSLLQQFSICISKSLMVVDVNPMTEFSYRLIQEALFSGKIPFLTETFFPHMALCYGTCEMVSDCCWYRMRGCFLWVHVQLRRDSLWNQSDIWWPKM